MVIHCFIWILVLLNLSCGVLPQEQLNTLYGHKGNALHWASYDFPLNIMVTSAVSGYEYDKVIQEVDHLHNLTSCNLFNVGRIDKDDPRVVLHKHRDIILSYSLSSNFSYGETLPWESIVPGYLYAAEVGLNKGMPKDALNKVILHELLHVLGLDHDMLKSSVLYKDASASNGEVEAVDVSFIRLWCL